jgi:hypothetical protein
MKTRERNPPSPRFGATRMEDGGWNPRSVLECGDWRGTGLAPLWNESRAQMNPAHVKAACALTPHPPQSKTWRLWLVYFCFLLSAFCFRAWGQSYSIDWYKIAGGGGTSTGGVYSVSGTIGQHDAGGPMTGGNYSLTGGFWALYAVQTPGAPVLSIELTTTNTAMVYWPSPSTGFNLEVSTNLATANWATPPQSVTDNGTIKYIIVNPPAGNRFYRLRSP